MPGRILDGHVHVLLMNHARRRRVVIGALAAEHDGAFADGHLCVTNGTVDLADVLGRSIDAVIAALHVARSWEARLDILDREIAARIGRRASHRAPSPGRAAS